MNTEIIKQLEESIDTLKKGRSIKVGEFILEGLKKGRIRVDGYIFYNTMYDVPKTIIKDELQKVKERFTLIMNESKTFKEYALNAGIDYYLVLDYQTGGASICAEIEGEYKVFI